MLTLEAWVQTLPMLSDSAKQTILADCLEDGRNREDLDEVASGGSSEARPSLTKMVELLDDEMRIFEQDLAELKETMRSCEARIKPQVVQKDPREGANFYDDGTRLDRTLSDGASTTNLSPGPAKRPYIVTPDLQETAQVSSGATKKQKSTASTKTRKPRKGAVSDEAWARERATSSRDIPVQRPSGVCFVNLSKKGTTPKWRHISAAGKLTFYDTIDGAYDAAIRDQQQHPPVPYTSGLSDEMWQRERMMSSLDLPEKRPQGLHYVKLSKKWRLRVAQNRHTPLYPSLDAAYNALRGSTSSS